MNEENLLDLTRMSWISPALCDHWQTLDACITEGEQIEASTVLNILNGILNAVVQSSSEIERLHLEPDDAALLGRAMDCLTRLYLSYHRQYIREQGNELHADEQAYLQNKAKEADLYGEFLAYLKSAPQVWRLRQMEAEIQRLNTSLEDCREENKRLLGLSNQTSDTDDLKTRIKTLEDKLAAQQTAAQTAAQIAADRIKSLEAELAAAQQPVPPLPPVDDSIRINLEAHIKTLEDELAAQQAGAQAAAQLAADRIKILEDELAAAKKAPPAAAPAPHSDPDPIPKTAPTPSPRAEAEPPADDGDVFHPAVVNNGICSVKSCDGKTKLGAPAAEIRDQIEYLDLSECSATEIADYAFRGCTNLKKVVMPLRAVIGTESFAGCPKLEEVDLECTPRVGDRAFRNCTSLQKVYFTGRYTEISKDAFDLCPQAAFRCKRNGPAAAYAAEHGIDIF